MAHSGVRVWARSLILTRDGDLIEFDSRLPNGMVRIVLRELQIDDWSETSIILTSEQVEALRQWLREKK